MRVLAIETSCDETAAAVVSADDRFFPVPPMTDATSATKNTRNQSKLPDFAEISALTPTVESNAVVSQIDIFAEYGGVIPEVAARSHLETILPVIDKALADAHRGWDDIDTIAVTHTPGLLGSLLIGTLTARTLAILHDKPLFPVHHLKSHIFAAWIRGEAQSGSDEPDLADFWTPPSLPVLALVISGGHTQIIFMPAFDRFEIVGTTRDDAVGECFDKVAKILGLHYPGGPAIAQAAQGILPEEILRRKTAKSSFAKTLVTEQNAGTLPQKSTENSSAKVSVAKRNAEPTKNTPSANPTPLSPGDPFRFHLPHPKVDGLDFSFSGLKTAALRAVQKEVDKPINFPSHQLAPLLSPQQVCDFAASFEQTVANILTEKLGAAIATFPKAQSVVVAGGVSANQTLRHTLTEALAGRIPIFFPEPKYCGDNGAMVGVAALFEIAGSAKPTDPYRLDIMPRSPIR